MAKDLNILIGLLVQIQTPTSKGCVLDSFSK